MIHRIMYVYKILMIKKGSLHLLLVILTIVSTNNLLKGQNTDTLRISVSAKNTPLITFFKDIESRYPVKFYYKQEWFAKDTVYNSFNDVPLTDVLHRIFRNKPYLYEVIQNNMIIFLPKEDVAFLTKQMVDMSTGGVKDLSTIVIGNPDEAGKYKKVNVHGIVEDGKNGEPLIGATIQIENTTQGVVSNTDGKYSLSLKPGIYTLKVSSIGFKPERYKVKVISNGNLDIELFEKSVKISEVSVYAQRADRNVRNTQMSLIEMDAKSIKLLPSIIGEKDIIKSMTMLPGVKSIGEFGSGINVRGGGEDQNLYLVEGAPLFNTSHVFGLLSVINPDLVNNVTLYKGHIPAEYGERVSSVMDIQVRNNIDKKFEGKGGIGLYNSRFMVGGSLLNKKVTFKLGGRTSYSDWLLKKMKDYNLKKSSASFYDLNGILNINLKNDRFTLFGYSSNDRFRYNSLLAYNYGNLLGSFDWSHFFSSNLYTSFTIAYSKYAATKDDIENILEQNRTKIKLEYTSAKLNTKFIGFEGHSINLGAKVIRYSIMPGELTPLNKESIINAAKLNKEQAFEGAAYINDVYEINDYLSINAGIRYSRYYNVGPGKVWEYRANNPLSPVSIIDSVFYEKNKIIKSYEAIEPRISAKIQFNTINSLKISYNKSSQYISLVSYSSIPTPNDIWKLSDSYIRPITSNQFAIGYYRNFLNNGIETSVEIYYKNLTNLLEYKNDAQLSMNPHIETELIDADGKNYGVEFLFRKNSGRLNGWIGYTWSRSLKKTNGIYPEEIINNNNYYPSSYDKPNDLTIVAIYQINRRMRASANFTYTSGRAITLPEYQYQSARQTIIYYSDRNKYRLPSYNRLDLSLSIDESLKIKKKWKGSWTFSILNVYARKNAYTVYYRKEKPDLSNDFRAFSFHKLYIIGIPFSTITYNFIF